MKLVELQVKDFLDAVDSKSPAPGGGSVSALLSSLGVALIRMVGHLTISKKKFNKLSENVQKAFVLKHDELLSLKDALLSCIDEDTQAFNLIMQAYGLPKDSDDEQTIRKQAIVEATKKAIEVPQKIANLSFRAMQDLSLFVNYGNQSALSDVGVGLLSLSAAIEGACMNVLINLSGLDDLSEKEVYQKEVKTLIKQAHHIRDDLISQVYIGLEA